MALKRDNWDKLGRQKRASKDSSPISGHGPAPLRLKELQRRKQRAAKRARRMVTDKRIPVANYLGERVESFEHKGKYYQLDFAVVSTTNRLMPLNHFLRLHGVTKTNSPGRFLELRKEYSKKIKSAFWAWMQRRPDKSAHDMRDVPRVPVTARLGERVESFEHRGKQYQLDLAVVSRTGRLMPLTHFLLLHNVTKDKNPEQFVLLRNDYNKRIKPAFEAWAAKTRSTNPPTQTLSGLGSLFRSLG
jgi:hypothetical protein